MKEYFVSYAFSQGTGWGFGNATVKVKGKFDFREVGKKMEKNSKIPIDVLVILNYIKI